MPNEAPGVLLRRARQIRPAALLLAALAGAALLAALGFRTRPFAGTDNEGARSRVELAAMKCHTAQPSENCHSDVMFIKKKFLKEHPDWYRGLTETSSFKDIQAYLNRQKDRKGDPRCPWPCDYVVTTSAAPDSDREGHCHDAKSGEDCYSHIKYTLKQVGPHPDWYGGLSPDSSFKDVQAYLHRQKASVCPLPCGRLEDEKEAKKADDKPCQTAVRGEACWDAVHWVLHTGYKKHPEWFKGITAKSTPEEVQNYLAGRNGSHCERRACHCHTAITGEDCFTHVSFTMKAIPDHPSWYPGLTTDSSEKEVQAFMHEEKDGKGNRVCPMPCGLNHDKSDKHHHRCHTAIAGEPCYDQVLWAMEEVEAHPEWYPGLNKSSSVADFQALLHLGKKDSMGRRCPIPCDEEAVDMAHNNSIYLDCHIAQKGEPCYDKVVEVYNDTEKHPEKYDGISMDSTFEEVQTYVHSHGAHCDNLPCHCHTAVKGEKCYESVSWVLSTGIKLHKSRFEMLSAKSTREEVQQTLHAERQHHCLLPCAAPWSTII